MNTYSIPDLIGIHLVLNEFQYQNTNSFKLIGIDIEYEILVHEILM